VGQSGRCRRSRRRKSPTGTTLYIIRIRSSAAGCEPAPPAGVWTWRTSCPTSSSPPCAPPRTRRSRDGVVLGEVWEDGSNKISYSSRRKYLLGSRGPRADELPAARTADNGLASQGGDAPPSCEAMETHSRALSPLRRLPAP
jgi:hypothetical protein